MGRLIDADKYMKRLQLAINDDADTIAKYIKRDTPIGTVKDGGRIGRLQGLQWCKNVLELDYYTVEAIPKDQYEARLKADMIAILTEIKLKIMEKSYYDTTIIGNYEDEVRINLVELDDVNEIIIEKINALKEKI